uniref:ATP synthase subunit d, mitochondrial n=1 Tax=Ceratosolen solmsi TaxID=142686 RepID=A0A0A1CS82_9HYME|nr:mitochondrial ATP synthase subunit d [Ceratosolen solmsi]
MAGRKAIKNINWTALLERVPEHEKMNFSLFKAKSEKYFKSLEDYPEELPKINWELYKKKISVPGLVEKFQKEYESFKVAYPEDKYTSTIAEEAKKVDILIKQFIDQSNKRIEDNLNEIKALESMMKYGDMTMEDFKDMHPDLAFDPKHPTIFPHEKDYQPDEETDKQLAKY